MANESHEGKSDDVQVTDRRSSTSSGERRETTSTEQAPSTSSDPAADAVAGDSDAGSTDYDAAPPSIDFIAFVQSLYVSALIALGEVQNPETRLLTTNLDIARQDIDILAMLLDKTRGNLTPSEDSMLQQVVPQLQLLYAKKAR